MENAVSENEPIRIDPAWLAPTRFMDYETRQVQHFVHDAVGDATTPREKAIRLYYAVRDRIRYDPYSMRMEAECFAASRVLQDGIGYCVPKAMLYAACLRAVGIPARPGFADVRNHLTTERLLELIGTDLFIWHGYVALLVEGKWVKATPAFNIEMCQRFDVQPLEFDGLTDSLMHPYDMRRQRHMEYVLQRGECDDLPFDELVADMKAAYPRLLEFARSKSRGDFAREAIHEGS